MCDDLCGAGKLKVLLHWWKKIEHMGPLLGYYPKASKSWLIVKTNCMKEAEELFKNTGIIITD